MDFGFSHCVIVDFVSGLELKSCFKVEVELLSC